MFQGKPNQLELCCHFDTLYAACSLEWGKHYVKKKCQCFYLTHPKPFFPYYQDRLKAFYLQLYVLHFSSCNTLIKQSYSRAIVSALADVLQYKDWLDRSVPPKAAIFQTKHATIFLLVTEIKETIY